MKKFIALAAIAVGFASCSSEDVAEQANLEPQAIAFDSYVGGQTRGTQIASTEAAIQFNKVGFDLYANVKEGTSGTVKPFMNKQAISYDGTAGKWVYAPIKYWPTESGSTLDFYPRWEGVPTTVDALSSDALNIQTVYDWNNIPQVTFYVNNSVMNQTDYLWAAPVLGAKRSSYTTEPVKFQFKHALSAFDFKIKVDGLVSEVSRFSVESVKVTGYFAPKATLNTQETDITKIWNYQGDWEKRSYTISDKDFEIYKGDDTDRYGSTMAYISRTGADKEASTGNTPGKGTIFVLPFNNTNYDIELTYSVTTWKNAADKASNTEPTKETYTIKKENILAAGTTLEPGKLYENQITLTLLPVEVSASLVDWTVATTAITMP